MNIDKAVLKLGKASTLLWAKTSASSSACMPLITHMIDTSCCIDYLWNFWLSDASKKVVCGGLRCKENSLDESDIRCVLSFLAASHDLGKAIPAFQANSNSPCTASVLDAISEYGLVIDERISDWYAVHHSVASEFILRRNGVHLSLALIVGGHHGVTPLLTEVLNLEDEHLKNTGFSDDLWINVQNELFAFACNISGMSDKITSIEANVDAQVLITGLVVMADWIASNEALFPLSDEIPSDRFSESRKTAAFKRINFPRPWVPNISKGDFKTNFGFEPRPFQILVSNLVSSIKEPGIIVIEVPMGEGKTEAALYAAGMISSRHGQDGVMFGLPTQATADGIFVRMSRWISRVMEDDPESHTFFLAHGRSKYNTNYQKLDRIGFGESSSSRVVVNEWFSGTKKGLLSDFVVGTVDNILMMGLKRKYLVLRHLALSGKVVIIDECHAYDAYMSSYLALALEWLGAYHIPVIILSATLPPSKRSQLVNAYIAGRSSKSLRKLQPISYNHYPIITYSDGDSINAAEPGISGRQITISIEWMHKDNLVSDILSTIMPGVVIGIFVNTIVSAQDTYSQLKELFPEADVMLLHSAFITIDRSYKESQLLETVGGKRGSLGRTTIVVGTQVIEQSLDLDFDRIYTDICPVDLLIQRIGRLHRHDSVRPDRFWNPVCVILDSGEGEFDKGSEAVYGRFHLLNTRRIVDASINIPEDIAHMVADAYSEENTERVASEDKDYQKALKEEQNKIKDKERKAKGYQIMHPYSTCDISGFIEGKVSEDMTDDDAECVVRDIDGSLTVIIIQRKDDGLHFIPWVNDGRIIGIESGLSREDQFILSGCLVPLPYRLVSKENISVTRQRLDEESKVIPDSWKRSLMDGASFLVLDENMEADLMCCRLRYDWEKGLMLIE